MNKITRDNLIDIVSWLEMPSKDSYNFMISCREFRAIVSEHFADGRVLKEIRIPKFVSPFVKRRNVDWNYQYLLLGRRDVVIQNKWTYFKAFLHIDLGKITIVTKKDVIIRDYERIEETLDASYRPTGYHYQYREPEYFPVITFVPDPANVSRTVTVYDNAIHFVTRYYVRNDVDMYLFTTLRPAFC